MLPGPNTSAAVTNAGPSRPRERVVVFPPAVMRKPFLRGAETVEPRAGRRQLRPGQPGPQSFDQVHRREQVLVRLGGRRLGARREEGLGGGEQVVAPQVDHLGPGVVRGDGAEVERDGRAGARGYESGKASWR